MANENLPAFPGRDVISLLYFQPSSKGESFFYLGLFRGKDRLLQFKAGK
jgi:hypothetical protein